MKTHYRSIFISDIHLGSSFCQAEKVLSFLEKNKADTIYLVGDIIDGWELKNKFYWPNSHNDVIRRFLKLAEKQKIVYVVGNHDEFLRRYYGEYGNLKIVEKATHLGADGKLYLVIHGDFFDVVIKHAKWLAYIGDYAYHLAMVVNKYLNKFLMLFGYKHWSLSAWLKQNVKQAVNFIGEFEKVLAMEAVDQGVSGVICGHIHHAEIKEIFNIKYMNTGDWVESCTAIVETIDGSFELLRF